MADDQAKSLPILAGLLLLGVPLGIVFSILLVGGSADATCNPDDATSVELDPATIPADLTIGVWDHEQILNAAYIIKAGSDKGFGTRDQTIAVMTAIGESTLVNLDYDDDATNPDGTTADGGGLFQQQPSQGWGTWEEVTDPYTSAGLFFDAMELAVPEAERSTVPPTLVAHRTQINEDPFHYEKSWDDAVLIVAGLAGTDIGLSPGTGGLICNADQPGKVPGAPGVVGPQEWAVPAGGTVSSSFGDCSVDRAGACHFGTDLADGTCGGPIWAAAEGTVSTVSRTDLRGNYIIIDHGGALTTRYLHMFADGVFVKEGDQVEPGMQIGAVGNDGLSYGCHLHYEVRELGVAIDAEPFMADKGAGLPR